MPKKKIIVIHRAFNENALPVCEITFEKDLVDIDALEKAYKMTQNVDSSWSRSIEMLSNIKLVSDLPKNNEGKELGFGSTSIGDLAVVEDENGIKFYQCASVGWGRLGLLEFLKILSINNKKDLKDYIHHLYLEEEEGITLKGR